ncbi:sigma-70 family RNA polymerase sigma factor [Maribacter sp. 2210JD10-5]|uniref:sigma-70 family RNA polymerase sigma factor n=1 Tax=Maribacter sp. 2210JD10-5 TaxID=3386272 RepID=UPI0039BD2F90
MLNKITGKDFNSEQSIIINKKQALKSVFERYYKPLTVFANKFVPVMGTCEDMVQDVFMSVWQSQAEFLNEKVLRSYLYKTVKNKCLNYLKHERVKHTYEKEMIIHLEDAHIVEQKEVEIETARLLHEAIGQLPDRQREVILRTMKGLKNDAISERMGIRLQTVKTLKSQAYKRLRTYFKQLDN